MRYLPFVRRVARHLGSSIPEAEVEDLVAAGTVGLLEAFARYDPERGVALTSFAYPRVKGAILDEIDRQRGRPRSGGGGDRTVPLDAAIETEEAAEVQLAEVIANPASPAPVVRAELTELLEAVASLSGREREIIRLQAKGFSVAEIAWLHRCSQSRASQLLERARLRLLEATAA